jgi:hypothetical protein
MFLAFAALWRAGATAGPMQVLRRRGICSNDACNWGAARTVADFDAMNHWLIDRWRWPPVGEPGGAELRASAEAAEPDDRRHHARRCTARHDATDRPVFHQPELCA